jgi:hypothetical protein
MQPASAWGQLGHRITGDIAESLLSPVARRQVAQLLGDEPLSAAATYMDRERDALNARWSGSARWHYDNEPVCGNRSYCRDENCATAQIKRFQKILGDKYARHDERAMALRLLVHMLGDIHQPLHRADNDDRGGNDVMVRLYSGAERRNLHEVYDTELVKQLLARTPLDEFAAQLLRQHRDEVGNWSKGTPTQWAEETHQLALRDVYGRLPGFACGQPERRTITLPTSYVAQARIDTSSQLVKAGARIAAVLNATLHD